MRRPGLVTACAYALTTSLIVAGVLAAAGAAEAILGGGLRDAAIWLLAAAGVAIFSALGIAVIMAILWGLGVEGDE